jgi:hypothetical protein
LISYDVIAARSKFNFSDWNANPGELSEMEKAVQEGKMPPIQYRILHPNSHLNDQQKQEMIQGLDTSLK